METDKEIRESQVLTKLLRENTLGAAVKSTSDLAQKSAVDFSSPEAFIIEPINPKLVYRAKMRNVRRVYMAEADALYTKAKQEKKQKEQVAIDTRILFDADVEKRKRERSLMNADITFDKDIQPDSTVQDSIVMARQEQWNKWEAERKETKFQNLSQSLQAASEKRLEHLVFLFQSAKDFVTLDNLEQRLGMHKS